MAFPDEPTIASPLPVPSLPVGTTPLPVWAYGAALKVDPTSTIRSTGWTLEPGQAYGEQPPLEYQNNEMFNNGQWITYFKQVADYIKNGGIKPSYAFIKNSGFIARGGLNALLTFDTVNYLNSSFNPWDTSTSLFTAPISGYYFVNVYGNVEFSVSGPNLISGATIQLYVNNMAIAAVIAGSSTFTSVNVIGQFSNYIFLNSGDIVSFKSYFSGQSNPQIFYSTEPIISISWNI